MARQPDGGERDDRLDNERRTSTASGDVVFSGGGPSRTNEPGRPAGGGTRIPSSTVTFGPGTGITKIALSVRGRVPGIDDAAFQEAAEGAKQGCPVSEALASVPEITLDASVGQ